MANNTDGLLDLLDKKKDKFIPKKFIKPTENAIKPHPLGLKGIKPQQFGVDPVPPNSLHYHYSTDGTPNIRWRGIGGVGKIPPKLTPSMLDNNKNKYKPSDPYTVGLNIISDKTIDGVGSINYTSQTTTNSGASS